MKSSPTYQSKWAYSPSMYGLRILQLVRFATLKRQHKQIVFIGETKTWCTPLHTLSECVYSQMYSGTEQHN